MLIKLHGKGEGFAVSCTWEKIKLKESFEK